MKSDRFDDFGGDESPGDPAWGDDFRDELAPGETLVWAGRPRQRWFSLSMLPVAIFGFFFGGFALFWIVMALSATGVIPAGVGGRRSRARGRVRADRRGSSRSSACRSCWSGSGWSPRRSGRAGGRPGPGTPLTDRRVIIWMPSLWSGVRGPELSARADLGSVSGSSAVTARAT